MKNPRILTIDGVKHQVPPHISRSGNGWQVRYAGTKFFSDGQHPPAVSLKAAVSELQARYAGRRPVVRSSVRETPLRGKASGLPAGISGPVLIVKRGRAPYAEFKVTLPRRGKPNAGTSVYIGTENSWSAERYTEALAKAVRLRTAAVRAAR